MNRRNIVCSLAIVLLIAGASGLHAQARAKRTPGPSGSEQAARPEQGATGDSSSSVKKGDPPPGNAMALSVPEAQTALKEAIEKRYVGTVSSCQHYGLARMCSSWTLSRAANVQVSVGEFAFGAPFISRPYGARRPIQNEGAVAINFKKNVNYVQVFHLGEEDPKIQYQPKVVYSVGFLPAPGRAAMALTAFSWLDESAASSFADAFNRLVYAANHDENFPSFVTAAKAWRENSAKPPLSPEVERHRTLAETALDNQNLESAIEHYEKGLEIQSMWPEGWYSLAILYAEQNNYAGATNCIKHYLELAPDAPDAKEAREKMVAWEAKAKR